MCLTLTDVPHFNALAGVILCQYRQEWYIAKKLYSLAYIFAAESIGVSSTIFTWSIPKATKFGEITVWLGQAITPFNVIQGHRVWYQSKAHMRLLISDQY